MEPVGVIAGSGNQDGHRKPAGVPRRFGIGALLVVTACYSVLFGLLRAISGVPVLEDIPVAYVVIIPAVFVTAVGIGQAVLFQGKRPRHASVAVGCCLGLLLVVCLWLSRYGLSRSLVRRLSFVWLLWWCAIGPILGGIAGYVSGALAAGVFLIMGRFEKPNGDHDAAAQSETATDVRSSEQGTHPPADWQAPNLQPGKDPPVEPVNVITSDGREERFAEFAAVPGRFLVGRLLVIAACYAVCVLLVLTGIWPATFMAVPFFVAAVGVGRAVLFRGKRPRTASVLVGIAALAFPTLAWLRIMYLSGPSDSYIPPGFMVLVMAVYLLPIAVIWGGFLGYLTGQIIAHVSPIIRRVARAIRGEASQRRKDVPVEPVICADPNRVQGRNAESVGVPRRFRVGSLLVVTAFYSVLFGLLRALDAEPVREVIPVVLVVIIPAVFVTAVGIGQAVLFQGKKPRQASIVVGGGAGFLIFVYLMLPMRGPAFASRPWSQLLIQLELLASTMAIGAIMGYLSGLLAAGVFLIMNRFASARRGNDAADP